MVNPEALLVIAGPTGVGKTAVAVRLGAALPLEVVSADSRQVYRGLDIGTGKPARAEQAALRHHLLDVVDPGERYHAARFRVEALAVLEGIRQRGRLPAVVGGTGLYVRALLRGLRPAPPADPALRRELERLAVQQGAPALHRLLAERDPAAAAGLHPNDRVRLIRALEVGATGRGAGGAQPAGPGPGPGEWATSTPPFKLLMIGLGQERAALTWRIAERVRGMVARGMMEEVRRLLDSGVPESAPGMAGIGYRHFAAVLRGRMDEAEAVRLTIRDTTRYAKRQMTWFARDPEIRWLDVDRAGGVEGAADVILKLCEAEGLIG